MKHPDEELNVPEGGKRNFEYRWCTQALADKAEGTTVLGVLDGAEDRVCFAVVEVEGMLANGLTAEARMVHIFTNEQGSGGSRRVFLALTGWGRLLFVRAAKWAMGEEVPPYQPLKITGVTNDGSGLITLSWEGSIHNNYRVNASDDFQTWHTVADDILGQDGIMSQTLDISAAPDAVLLQIAAVP